MPIGRAQKAGGALAGGLGGAAAGAIFGPIGAGIGGLLGLGAGYLGGDNTYQQAAKNQKKMGGKNGMNNIGRGDNPQQQRADWAGNYAQQQLSNNQFNFDPIEAQARQGFQRNTLPGIGNAFTRGGTGPESSAYWNAQLGAQGDLESNLASMRSKYGLDQQKLLQNLFEIGQKSKFGNYGNNDEGEYSNNFFKDFNVKDTIKNIGSIKDMWGQYQAGMANNQSAAQTVQSQFNRPYQYQSQYMNPNYQSPSLNFRY